MFNLRTLERARDAQFLNAAGNGHTGVRERKPRSIRMPSEVWDNVKRAAEQLRVLFPDRYVTVNSTLEFLIQEGLNSLYQSSAAEEE
tara:strand:+ start:2995 stop:3255 length:261 start_codon:yes stop_codon:yes gene_type:complete